MKWFIYVIVGILSFVMHKRWDKKEYNWLKLIEGTFVVNILTLFILRWVLNNTDVLLDRVYGKRFSVYYIACSLVLIIISILIRRWVSKQQIVEGGKQLSTNKWARGILFVSVLLSAFFMIFTVWFIEYFGQLTPEQFLFNLSSPIKGTSTDANQHIYTSVILTWLVVCIGLFYSLKLQRTLRLGNFTLKSPFYWVTNLKRAILLSATVLIIGVGFTVWHLKLVSVVHAFLDESTYIEDNYIDPEQVQLIFPTQKRNLIHIYLESVENSYFDRENGGYFTSNLMPELLEIAHEGISFSHNDFMGGPYQTYGSSWSVASMVNMGHGIPLKIAMDGNDYGKSGYFLPGAYGLGDILEKEGYEQTIMFGADADFGGLTTYFTSHGKFNIWDVKHARKEGYIPQKYNVWWGFEDDKLYEYAREEITRLSKTGKPFNFTMETADTHFPDGYLSKKAPTPHESQYANVISYSSSEASQFIRWIQQQPFYKDTVIIVTGDHLSMDKKFFKDFDLGYHRTVFNVILNSSVTSDKVFNRHYAPLDFFPTILASMGVEIPGNRLALGTNLFSGEPTLIERDGLEVFNAELGKNSNFYNQVFINEKNHEPVIQGE